MDILAGKPCRVHLLSEHLTAMSLLGLPSTDDKGPLGREASVTNVSFWDSYLGPFPDYLIWL